MCYSLTNGGFRFVLFFCFFSDYGGSSSVKYNTYNPSFSSKSSFMYSGSRTIVSAAFLTFSAQYSHTQMIKLSL